MTQQQAVENMTKSFKKKNKARFATNKIENNCDEIVQNLQEATAGSPTSKPKETRPPRFD